MGGQVGGINEEIVHVNSFCNHVVKGVIHKMLESGGGIGKTKEHHG